VPLEELLSPPLLPELLCPEPLLELPPFEPPELSDPPPELPPKSTGLVEPPAQEMTNPIPRSPITSGRCMGSSSPRPSGDVLKIWRSEARSKASRNPKEPIYFSDLSAM
jgi:hypothetical protein